MALLQDLRRLEVISREMMDLARVGLGLVKQCDLEALENTLARRHRVFAQMRELYLELGPAFSGWKEALASIPEREAEESRAVVDRVALMGHDLLGLDREASRLLEGIKADAGQDLKKLAQGSRLLSAYRPVSATMAALPNQFSRTG